MHWYLKVVKDNYANFSGRARRKEYWMFVLIQIVILILIISYTSIVDDVVGVPIVDTIFFIYFLATLIPWLAVNVRRLHDTGKSGVYLLVNLIPIIGRIWYIVLMASDGDIGPNKYGPDPKRESYDEIDDIGKLDE